MTRIDDAHHFSKKKIMLNSFLGGIMWGVGSVLGATIVIATLGFTLSKIDLIPVIGDFVAEISKYINEQHLNSPVDLPEPYN